MIRHRRWPRYGPKVENHGVTVALPGPGPKPRPLPADELLSAEDYRRAVGVVEAVDQAADLAEFRERLVRALQSWFGFQGVAVLHGDTPADAVRGGCGVRSGYSAEFLESYAAGWIREDPFQSEEFLERLAVVGVLRLGDVAADSRFVRQYLRPHGITDKAAMLIDAGPSGVLLVSVAVRDGVPRVADRDVAVLRVLRRHLAPLAVEQLGRHRARAGRNEWQLTPREWDVAELAAQGLTNRQIAERLFIGVDTVKKHLTRVLAATSCASRTQLAVLLNTRDTPV
jgi:DNA-binding CsgD family transcriptional regulator